MRRMIFAAVCAIGMMVTAPPSKAQVSVQVNISSQPLWGPVGYDYVEYYYLPDLEMYYYVPAHKFVYINGGRWIFASSLPVYYRDYDLYSIHKIVINEPRPYRYFHLHRIKYAGYRGGPHHQVFIRSSNNPKYFVVRGHPHHSRRAGLARPYATPTWWHGNRMRRAPVNAPHQKSMGIKEIHKVQARPHMQRTDRERIRQVKQPRRTPSRPGMEHQHNNRQHGGGNHKGGGHQGKKR